MPGQVYDTYVAALQHDLASVPADAPRIGVVRRPTPWFSAEVDENRPALAPPATLLDEVQDRRDSLAADGVPDAEAHNRAMAEAEFETRFESYLADAPATDALGELRARLEAGDDLVLVCYENTDEKRCHRTLVRSRLASMTDG